MTEKRRPGSVRLWLGLGFAVIVAGSLAWFLFRPLALPRAEHRQVQEIPGAIAPGLESGESEREFFARVPAARISENEKGTLVLGPEFLEIFEAFRARYLGLGEEMMFEAFAQWAREGYGESEAAFLTGVFRDYIEYLRTISAPDFFPSGASLGERFALMKDARERILGKEIADLLFAAHDKGFKVAMEIERIRNDESLSPEEKQAALEAFKNSLDPETREEFFPHNPHQEYREKLAAIQENPDLTPEQQARQTRALREDMFGPEAADRLETLDAERAARDERMAEYWQRAESVEFDESLSDDERAARLEELREELLSEEDVRRLNARQAFEKLKQLKPEDIAERIRAEREGELNLDWSSPEQQGANIGVEEQAPGSEGGSQ